MSRSNIALYQLAPAQSLSTSFITQPTVINYLDNCAYQIDILTSDSIGTFKVQGSLDYKQNQPGLQIENAGHWVDMPLSGSPSVSSANDDIMIDMNQIPFSAIRLVYTSTTAGTGIASIYVMGKKLGA